MRKTWFLAEMIFRLHDEWQPEKNYFSRYYYPIIASTEKEAYLKALINASEELEKRKDYTKEHLQWEFVAMESLTAIEKSEVTKAYQNKIDTPSDIQHFIYSLKKQNQDIQIRLAKVS